MDNADVNVKLTFLKLAQYQATSQRTPKNDGTATFSVGQAR